MAALTEPGPDGIRPGLRQGEASLATAPLEPGPGTLEPGPLEPGDVAQLIVDVAADKLAADIVLLDLRQLAPFADYFVIMSAESARQIEALEEDLTKSLKDAGIARHRREGTAASGWVLLDFSDVIAHIFAPEEREFYGLERLWARAPQVVRVL